MAAAPRRSQASGFRRRVFAPEVATGRELEDEAPASLQLLERAPHCSARNSCAMIRVAQQPCSGRAEAMYRQEFRACGTFAECCKLDYLARAGPETRAVAAQNSAGSDRALPVW